MTKKVLGSVVCLLMLYGCSVTSINSEYKARVDACNEIKDEALRVQCLKDIPPPGEGK